MLLTRYFVFVHVPKTGGSFVRGLLREHAPADWELVEHGAAHTPASATPASHRELPRFGCVRNPFAYYVSWYHFHQEHRIPFFDEVSDGGRLGFVPTMHRVFTHPHTTTGLGGPFTKLLDSVVGPGGRDVTHVLRTESIRAELLACLQALVPEVDAALVKAIGSYAPANTSRHEHYSRYYDDELRELVFTRDRVVFDLCGYTWETG